MVNSHLNYAILAWGFACTRLNKLQKRIIRTITCSRYNAHTWPLFKSLRLLTLHDMLKVNVLQFYHKCLHNELPPYFYSFNIRTQGDTHSYDTRNSGQLHIDRTRTEYADKRLRIYLPTLINDMPTELLATIATHSLLGFTKIAKQFLNNTHWYAQSMAVICVRALSIHHSVSNDIFLRWSVDICIYAYMCWFCLCVRLCAHVYSWAMCAHRQTYWQNHSSALHISQSCLHCFMV